MRPVTRALVFLIELVAEILLLGVLMGFLVSSQLGLIDGTIGSVLALPVVLFLHGYYLTRALALSVWNRFSPLVYPFIAVTLFLLHTHLVFLRLKPGMSQFGAGTELPFLVAGACVVFACARGGNRLARDLGA